jgi:hypothetical protein
MPSEKGRRTQTVERKNPWLKKSLRLKKPAPQGRYLVAVQGYKDQFDRLLIPETHVVQVIGLDMSYGEGEGFLTGCIAVQYAGLAPKVILMNKTAYEAHFCLA